LLGATTSPLGAGVRHPEARSCTYFCVLGCCELCIVCVSVFVGASGGCAFRVPCAVCVACGFPACECAQCVLGVRFCCCPFVPARGAQYHKYVNDGASAGPGPTSSAAPRLVTHLHIRGNTLTFSAALGGACPRLRPRCAVPAPHCLRMCVRTCVCMCARARAPYTRLRVACVSAWGFRKCGCACMRMPWDRTYVCVRVPCVMGRRHCFRRSRGPCVMQHLMCPVSLTAPSPACWSAVHARHARAPGRVVGHSVGLLRAV
jgi:hypothetical protein